MADDVSDKRRRSKKKRSSLLTWKKKFNIKKRFTNKLPLHRRHVRALMSGWSVHDVRSVLTQYEITAMLKQLAFMADKSRPSSSSLEADLSCLFKVSSCCDILISCCEFSVEDCYHQGHTEIKAHKSLLKARWPAIRKIIKTQTTNKKRNSYQETAFSSLPNDTTSPNKSELQKIHINGITFDKLTEILKEIYEGTKFGNGQSNPRKLLPLPTTDDSLHIRNSRGKQPYRHTILECDQPVVPRRNVARRKHKQRFSMDERILSSQAHLSPTARGQQQARSCKLTSGEIIQTSSSSQYLKAFDLASNEGRASIHKHKEIPNSIQEDLMKMYQDVGDVKIVFSTDSSNYFSSWITPHARRRDISNHYQAWISHYELFHPMSTREWQDPLYCHRVILAARSPYFRRLIEKQMSSPAWMEASSNMTTIEVEGSIIPPRYMSAVLYTMYTDKVDLHRLYDRMGQRGIPMGGAEPAAGPFYMRDAIMLHHIGCFIEFPKLVHGCEEFIVDNLDQNNILQVLQWTSLPHGSEWVKRQVNNFIRERFSELLSTGVLFELDSSQIIDVLESDFVNSSELDILKCALRWGEHELLKRIEKREPNLLTHTAHSVSRSKTGSAKRRELIASRIDELHECTADVLAFVRMQHILPANHELFTNAVKRGVISRPPADLLENVNEGSGRQWIKSGVDFVPPRLFQPYVDETKNILDERFSQDSDCVSLRSVHNFSRDQTWCSVRQHVELASHGIPDALYMVGQARLPSRRRYGNRDLQLHFPPRNEVFLQRATKPVKYIGEHYPVPDASTLRELFTREREFRSTYIVNKVLRACIDCCHSNSKIFGRGNFFIGRTDVTNTDSTDPDETEYCNRCSAIRLVRLFVVRERGLPDCAIDILQQPELYYDVDELRTAITNDAARSNPIRNDRSPQALGRLDSLFPAQQLDEPEDEIERDTTPRDSPRKQVIYFDRVGASSRNQIDNRSSSPARSDILDLSPDLSTSSSSDEEIPERPVKRRSLSRKGSSSTTSYHSIPDVAASANSSLQRLRISTQEEVMSAPPLNARILDDFVKTSESETSSSSSSCEENTSENEEENLLGIASNFSDIVISQIAAQCSDAGFGREVSKTFGNRTISNHAHKIQPPKRPMSAGMSQLFTSKLNFIDCSIDSSDDDLGDILSSRLEVQGSMLQDQRSNHDLRSLGQDERSSLGSGQRSRLVAGQRSNQDSGSATPVNPIIGQPDIPELVKDGTLLRGHTNKPDIYPSQGDLPTDQSEVNEQCGQYFFCSLTRNKMSKNKGEKSTPRTSFTFALSEGREESTQKKENIKTGDTKQKTGETTIFL